MRKRKVVPEDKLLWQPSSVGEPVKDLHHPRARERRIDLAGQALPSGTAGRSPSDPQWLAAGVSPKTLQEINARAARNFSLASRIVAAAMAKGIYRSHEPREVVDLLWSLFVGLVYLSQTRKNLGLTLSTLKDLHRKVFRWLEEGLRAR